MIHAAASLLRLDCDIELQAGLEDQLVEQVIVLGVGAHIVDEVQQLLLELRYPIDLRVPDLEIALVELEDLEAGIELLVSALSSRIFLPARRMRSLAMSAIVTNPALAASVSGLHFSGSCTQIHLRLPPSSALSCITAWAVVPEPAKKSMTISSEVIFPGV